MLSPSQVYLLGIFPLFSNAELAIFICDDLLIIAVFGKTLDGASTGFGEKTNLHTSQASKTSARTRSNFFISVNVSQSMTYLSGEPEYV